jgi:hypothetical protein
MTIKMTYKASDGFTKRGSFKTVAGAKAFAAKWVGETPEVGTTYAVSPDGVGRVTWSGVSKADLFGETLEEEFERMQREEYEAEQAWLASEYDDEVPEDRFCPECGLVETLDPLGGMSCKNGCCYG